MSAKGKTGAAKNETDGGRKNNAKGGHKNNAKGRQKTRTKGHKDGKNTQSKSKSNSTRSPAASLASSLHLPTRAMIGGRLVDAAGGRTFPSINPATGEELAQIADCGAIDVDRAVAAARQAFEGPWGRIAPVDRKRL
ncbi:MAG: aldehyde dehydrogenase family protein, partial [Acidimicrobiales bacterium]